MIIGVYGFLSNLKKSSHNVLITTINSNVAEANICTMKCLNDASVLYMFLTLDIKGINDIRLISNPIHAPSRELEDTDTNTHPLLLPIPLRPFQFGLGFMVSEQYSFPGWGCQPHAHPQLSWRTDDFLSGLSPLADQSRF